MSNNSRVKIKSLALESTEDSVSDYFSFCGDIKAIHVYSSDDGESKEAVLKFENDSAAATAVLLNNALVEGRNISVELYPDSSTGSPVAGRSASAAAAAAGAATAESNGSPKPGTPKSVVTEIVNEAKSVASQVTAASRDFDAKYDVTGKVMNAWGSAVSTTSKAAQDLDAKYNIKDNAGKAYETSRQSVINAYSSLSSYFTGKSGSGGSAGSASGSPAPPQQ